MLYVLLLTELVPVRLPLLYALASPYCCNKYAKVPLVIVDAFVALLGNFHPFGQILPEAFAFTIVPPVPAVAAFHW